MKRPSFQFYPGDWTGNSNLRRCTHAEKGVWVEVLCLMHDQAEYGVLRWPLKEIVEAVKCKPADLRALVSKGVLKGSDDALAEPYIYTPRSGRKDGEPVILLDTQPGPIWYSSRMVKDEHVRTIRGESTRFGEESGEASKRSPKPPFGDGSSSSSSSSSSSNTPHTPKGVRFAEFWETWPSSQRKVAKAECEKRWKARGLDAEADAILAHVVVSKGTRQWLDGYEPAPLTYLNQKRWQDDETGQSDLLTGSGVNRV